MEQALRQILDRLRESDEDPGQGWLDRLLRERSRQRGDGSRVVAKRRLLPFYLAMRDERPEAWAALGVDAAIEERLLRLLRAKPRRTASGVATVTVLAKPWPCSGDCLYCPSDVRMPKSYLSDEPACQRAERLFFDPYLQVAARMRTLRAMGHPLDKVELIVLGGTWEDYPQAYRLWFVRELFRALNDLGELSREEARAEAERIEADYAGLGLSGERERLSREAAPVQAAVDAGELSHGQALASLPSAAAWRAAAKGQVATWDDVEREHACNERAAHRCVGLVVETRPELVTGASLRDLRRLGCTKVQMGVQSLDDATLAESGRAALSGDVARALRLLRAFGFKTHAHFMANLPGATPETDRADYARLVGEAPFLPDEVKLYPCCLVASARLMGRYRAGSWRPYTQEELVGLLVDDVAVTPCHTRISRMVRDISAADIVAGNRKANLRELVEARLRDAGAPVAEMRHREVATGEVDLQELALEEVAFEAVGSSERFLQWVLPDGRLAAFLRLSLPDQAPEQLALLPTGPREAMVREVHVYGVAERLGRSGQGAQHEGLGRRLVERACAIAAEEGYEAVSVISAVGTRGYYRRLGFEDAGLYQRRQL